MNTNPLVSVFVITYNSSLYIEDTLDSVKNQTYKNIEIIISDDCSTDNTVELCRAWLEKNRHLFVRAELVSTPHNMGVAGNCNNAIKAANGIWIKGLSGDDLLMENSIEEYVRYIEENPDCRICFAKLHFFGDDEEFVLRTRQLYERLFYPYLKRNWKSQYKRILQTLFVPGPGLFLQKLLWEEVGRYDERYPFCEEHPFTLNVLEQGNRIYFIDKELYNYHIRHGSLSKEGYKALLSERVFNDNYLYFKEVRRAKMLKYGLVLSAWHETIYFYYYSLYYKPISKIIIIMAKGLLLFSPLSYRNILNRFIKRYGG